VRWIRELMKALAAEGRTVFVSSHLMTEMAVTADHLVVIARGRLVADCSTAEFVARHAPTSVRVRTPDPDGLAAVATRAGGTVRPEDDALIVRDLPAEKLAELAATAGIVLWELTRVSAALEDAFLEVTS
jgi:ABC-2 type transport system ATP-binding protein